jgi:hypothetical protein
MKKTSSWIGFQSDAVTHDRLRQVAEDEARSVSSLIRKIVADYFAERGQVPAPRQHRRRERGREASAA